MLYTEKQCKNLKNRVDEKLENREKDYWKCTSKPSYILHKIFDNKLIAIPKPKFH